MKRSNEKPAEIPSPPVNQPKRGLIDNPNPLVLPDPPTQLIPQQLTLEEQVSALAESNSKQQKQIDQLETQVNQLTDLLRNNLPIQDEPTQQLIAKTNELYPQILWSTNHYQSRLANQLFSELQQDCEAILTLASGRFQPESHAKTNMHATHEAAHLVPSLLDAARIASHSVHHVIPVLGVVLKAGEVYNDHRLIHKAQTLTKQLRLYSAGQREQVYRYVVLNTVLTLATRLLPIENDPMLMLKWCSLLLEESIISLSKLQQNYTIVDLADNWSQSVIRKFSQPGVNMPFSDQQCAIFDQQDLRVALEVQQLFTTPLPTSTKARAVILQQPTMPYLHELHQKIYENVLLPYDWRASSDSQFLSFLGFYLPSQLMLLQHYHGALVKALVLIDTKLRPLQNTANYALQLHLINTCCHAALSKMAALMPWHANASQVFNYAAYNYQLVCIQEPLQLQKNDKLKMASQLTAAWQEVTKANERTQQAEARVTEAETEKEAAKKEADDAKGREDQAEKKVKELKGQILTNNDVIKNLTTLVNELESRQNNSSTSISFSNSKHGLFCTTATPDAHPKNTRAHSYSLS